MTDEMPTSLDVIQAIYRDPGLPLSTRLRAAALALPFEYPKISTASGNGKGLANAIEAAYTKRIHAPQTQKLIAAERDRDLEGG